MVFDHLQDLATCTQGYGEKIIALDVQLTNTKEQLAAGTAVPVPALFNGKRAVLTHSVNHVDLQYLHAPRDKGERSVHVHSFDSLATYPNSRNVLLRH